MILLGNQIKKYIKEKKIIFDGDISNVGPNSVDVRLQKTIKTYVECEIFSFMYEGNTCHKLEVKHDAISSKWHLDPKKKNKVYEYEIPEDGLIVEPGVLYIGATIELAGTSNFVPMYEGVSSVARLGLQSHLAAGFGDIGFETTWTLEIVVVHPLKIYSGMRIGQVFFHTVDEDARLEMEADGLFYKSKYSEQKGPQESKSYLDYVEKDTGKKKATSSQ